MPRAGPAGGAKPAGGCEGEVLSWMGREQCPTQSQASVEYGSAEGTWREELSPPQPEAHQGHGVEVGEPLLLLCRDGQQEAQCLQLRIDLVSASLGGTLG